MLGAGVQSFGGVVHAIAPPLSLAQFRVKFERESSNVERRMGGAKGAGVARSSATVLKNMAPPAFRAPLPMKFEA